MSEVKYESVSGIRIRYLNYIKDEYDYIEIYLKHPECLLSFTSCRVRIQNLSECVNLRNLYSVSNVYRREDLESVYGLKRMYSYFD